MRRVTRCETRHDAALFEYYGTSQLAFVDVASGAVTRVGAPAVLSDVDLAPDGEHILVTSIRKPYSYAVTYGRFAHDVEVWDRAGKATPLAQLPLADRVPIHGVPTGPRDHAWRPTEPATLVWAEALDGGDWKAKVPARDKVMMQSAPFTAPPVEIARTEQRFAGHRLERAARRRDCSRSTTTTVTGGARSSIDADAPRDASRA